MADNSTRADAQENTAYRYAETWIERIYGAFDGPGITDQYHERHGVESMCILTVASLYGAQAEVRKLAAAIAGKTVVEIGAGVGMLALQMARHAKHVWAIEADPAWSWVFTNCLYSIKPPNLTWIFGRAQDLVGMLRADVAVVYTRSDRKGMGAIASAMAPQVIRGPLVEFSERYQELMTPEQLAYAQEIATEAMLSAPLGRKGLTWDQLRDVEERFMKRFPGCSLERFSQSESGGAR